MAAPFYPQAAYGAALQALLPEGALWPRDPTSVEGMVATSLAGTVQRNGARAAQLLVDAFPSTTVELLPDWEATLGLPDPCLGTQQSIALRQAAVAARVAARGGQSLPYLATVARAAGYEVTFTEFSPAVAGGLSAGGLLYGEAWAHALQVNAGTVTPVPFYAGRSSAGELLRSWPEVGPLACVLGRVIPAHTALLVSYADGT